MGARPSAHQWRAQGQTLTPQRPDCGQALNAFARTHALQASMLLTIEVPRRHLQAIIDNINTCSSGGACASARDTGIECKLPPWAWHSR